MLDREELMGTMATLLADRERSGGERSEPERSGRAANNAARPEPEVLERPQRRRYSQAYKERIVREAQACTEPGQIGALLRREGLYWSMFSRWRHQSAAGGRRALADDQRGRRRTRSPLHDEVATLRKENQRLREQLHQAETIIDVPKKLSQLVGLTPPQHTHGEPG